MDSRSPTEKRLFLGIPAPEGIFEPVQKLKEALADFSDVRWVKKENLHITVFFLGNVHEEMIPNLIEMIRVSLKDFEPFSLTFDQFCLAPKPQHPRMIWARYEKTEYFRQLVNRITDLYEQIQPYQQQRRSPTPHITVARLRGVGVGRQSGVSVGRQSELPPNAGARRQFRLPTSTNSSPGASFLVRELVLWSSDLQPDGAVYEELARFKL